MSYAFLFAIGYQLHVILLAQLESLDHVELRLLRCGRLLLILGLAGRLGDEVLCLETLELDGISAGLSGRIDQFLRQFQRSVMVDPGLGYDKSFGHIHHPNWTGSCRRSAKPVSAAHLILRTGLPT